MSVLDSTASDAELVAATLAGDRHAFGRIVERYQRLLCSVAYSATGRLSQSEDLAQEAFVEAWRHLGDLREPEKLRPWLCGILRFKISRLHRSDRREPVRQADELDAAAEIAGPDEPVPEQAIQKEEQALMWSALERVPELYREPLVLYYREHNSVEHVAAALDLTEDTVKQRLARGRKILQEQVLSFVEGALARSTPGRVFTIGVLAALPEFTKPAKAATIGAAAAKGTMLAKSAGLAGMFSTVSGFVSAVLSLRASLDQARTASERRAVVKITLGFFFGAWAFLGTVYGARAASYAWWEQRTTWAVVAQAAVLLFIVGWPVALLRVMKAQRALRSRERREQPESFRDARDRVGSSAREYRSRAALFGVPLVHVRYATPDEGEPPVVGWFAGGDRAYGLLCAWGGYAVAPFSVGAFAIGVIAIGNVSLGLLSFGTVGVGVVAIGCASVGYSAGGWLSALGWHDAQGSGFALAHFVAQGPIALAPHANDDFAHQVLYNPHAAQQAYFYLTALALLSVVPIALYARAIRRRLGPGRPREPAEPM